MGRKSRLKKIRREHKAIIKPIIDEIQIINDKVLEKYGTLDVPTDPNHKIRTATEYGIFETE